jgi:hypothetical protein
MSPKAGDMQQERQALPVIDTGSARHALRVLKVRRSTEICAE